MYRDFYRGNVKVTQELIPGSPNPPSCDAVLDALDTKVDKEEGKGLSSNDFTDADKQKLQDIEQVEIVNNLEDGGVDRALTIDTIHLNQRGSDIYSKYLSPIFDI